MIPVIVIEGPTASGKTALALELANKLHTEIISADSRQVYKFLNIGTAKPTGEELSSLKHHLIDYIKPDEVFNAGMFRKKATDIITSLHKQGKIPIICGGTGLYIKALLDGLFLEDVSDKEIRLTLINELNDKGLDCLFEELQKADKVIADKISKNDKQRILRALEVYRATGIPLSEHWERQKHEPLYNTFRILLNEDRAVLYKRIDIRVIEMIKKGLIDEIKDVLSKGYNWLQPGLNCIGYKEFRLYCEGESELNDCISKAQQHTRNYAKRQITWYNKYTFNLAGPYSSISLSNVEELLHLHFDRNLPR